MRSGSRHRRPKLARSEGPRASRRPGRLRVLLLFLLLSTTGPLDRPPAAPNFASASPSLASTAAEDRCGPLPAPTGTVIEVESEPELQAALRRMRDIGHDGTILLADGEYRLTNTLHLYGGLERVAIRGASGDRDAVVLTGWGMSNPNHANVPHGILVSDAQEVLIADLTIRQVYYHAIQVAGESGAADVTIYNTRLIDAGEQLVKGSSGGPPGPYADRGTVACSWLGYTDRARSDYTNGVDVLAGADWVVRDNDFVRIRAPIGQLAGPAVLFWRNSLRTLVERNRFLECDRAIALGLSSPDVGRARDGEARFDHQDGVIRNNIIHRAPGSSTGDIGISVNHHPRFAILHNTVIQHGSFAPGTIEYRFPTSSGRIAGNLTDGPIWRRDGVLAELNDNQTEALPSWFVDEPAGDLHLRPDAAGAIDQIAPIPEVLDDFDGQARPLGPLADLGADEWGDASAPASPSPSSLPPSLTPTLETPTAPSPTPSPTTPMRPTSAAPSPAPSVTPSPRPILLPWLRSVRPSSG